MVKSEDSVGNAGFFKIMRDFIVIMGFGFKFSTIETFTRHRKVNLEGMPKRASQTAVITGGARGIGAKAVKQLMMLDMHVIIACRNPVAGVKMVDEIRKEGIQTGTAEVLSLDLDSFQSVREFSKILLDRKLPINILINNAGIMFVPYKTTPDGLESHLQTNYLSHFLLTSLLLPLLTMAGTSDRASRVVNVSSCAHYGGQIDFSNLNQSKSYSRYMAYMSSKLMQVISTKDLDTRMTSEGLNVRMYSVHPGMVSTDLYQNVWWYSAFSCILKKFMRTVEQGADAVIYAAVAPEIETQGGGYFCNCQSYNPNSKVQDLELREKLLKVSEELVGIKWTDGKDLVDATTDLK